MPVSHKPKKKGGRAAYNDSKAPIRRGATMGFKQRRRKLLRIPELSERFKYHGMFVPLKDQM